MASTAPVNPEPSENLEETHMRWWKTILLVLLLAAVFQRGRHAIRHGNQRDFTPYYVAATLVWEGKPLYEQSVFDPELQRLDHVYRYYVYPPVFAVLISPISQLDFDTARWVWVLFLEAVLAAGLLVLCRRLRFDWYWAVVLCAFFFVADPTHRAFRQGQVAPILMTLIILSLVFWEKKPPVAGFLIALAVWIKIFPGVLLLPILLRKDWRMLAWTAAGLATIGAGTMVISGVSDTLQFITGVLPHMKEYLSDFAMNQSLSVNGILSVLGWEPVYSASAVAILAAGSAVAYRWREPGVPFLTVSFFLVLSLLVNPVVWGHYLPLAFPALVVLLRNIVSEREAEDFRYRIGIWSLVTLLICWLSKVKPPPFVLFLLLLALAVWTAIEIRRMHANRAAEFAAAGTSHSRTHESA
jgi:hypothetical protein